MNIEYTTYFISQPMSGISAEEILSLRDKCEEAIKRYNTSYASVIISNFNPSYRNPLRALGNSIMLLADADYCVFIDHCCFNSNSRGCNIEYQVCKKYGIKCLMYVSYLDKISEMD